MDNRGNETVHLPLRRHEGTAAPNATAVTRLREKAEVKEVLQKFKSR
jgi:hypothetical protein